jgi:hypothetical protein
MIVNKVRAGVGRWAGGERGRYASAAFIVDTRRTHTHWRSTLEGPMRTIIIVIAVCLSTIVNANPDMRRGE